MGKRMNRWLTVLLLAGTLAGTSVYGQQSEVEKQAQSQFDAKKYKECLATLEGELKKKDAPASTVRLGMKANLMAGNPMTASLLATQLLQLLGTKDADALYEAAEVAALCGDGQLAVSRYLSYIRKMRDNRSADDKVYRAVKYIQRSGRYEEVIEVLNVRKGPEATWYDAMSYANDFLSRGDKASYIRLLRYMLTPGFTDEQKAVSFQNVPAVLSMVIQNLNNNWNKFTKDEARELLNLLTGVPYPKKNFDHGQLYQLLERLYGQADLSPKDRFRVGRRFIENSGLMPSAPVFIYPCNAWLKACSDDESRKAAAKAIVAVADDVIKTQSADGIGSFIGIVGGPVFKGVTTPEIMAKLFGAHLDLVRTWADDQDWNSFNWVISQGVFKDDKENAVKFGNALIEKASPPIAGWIIAQDAKNIKTGLKDNAYTKYMASKTFTKGQSRINAAQLLQSLASVGAYEQFPESLKNVLLLQNYDVNFVADRCRESKCSGEAVAKAIQEVAGLTGNNAKLSALAKKLSENVYTKTAALKAVASAGASAGSDPAFTAAARLFNTDSKNAGAMIDAYEAFLKAYKGDIPAHILQAKSIKERLAYEATQACQYAVWNDDAAVVRMIKAAMPRFSRNGKKADEFLQRAWNIDQKAKKISGGLFYECLKSAIARCNEGKGNFWGNDSGWFSNNLYQPKEDTTLFTSFKNMNTQALYYILRSQENWSKDYFFKQLNAWLTSPDTIADSGTDWNWNNMMGRIINNLRWSNQKEKAKYYDSVPASTVIAMLQKHISSNRQTRTVNVGREHEIIRAMTRPDQCAEVLTAYINMKTDPKDPDSKFNAVASAITIGNWNFNMPADVRWNFASTQLKPLLAARSAQDWRNSWANDGLMAYFNGILNPNNKDPKDAARKAEAAEMWKVLRDRALTGDTLIGAWGNIGDVYSETLQTGVPNLVSSGNTLAINNAAVTMGWVLSRDQHTWRASNVADNVLKALAKTSPQIRYVYLNAMTSAPSATSVELKKKYTMAMSSLSKDIPGLVPVDKNDPAYNLFLSQQMKREGNSLQAWSLIRDKLTLFTQRWKEFDFDFALWVMEQARKSSLFKEAMELGQTMWMDESKLPAGDAAKLGLAKGDVYRDWKSYPAAKIEYESLTNNKRYSNTPAGRLAKFRLIELLILTQDYQTARTMLERLQTSKSADDQAEAYYLQARIDYEQQDDESAMQNLGEVFMRNSSHPEARLLQGEIMLRTNRLLFLELEIGQKKLATIAIPGKPIRLLIQDTNLSIIRGGKSLPVIVTTTKGKDFERVELMPNSQDPNKFSAELPTMLGKAVQNNMILEVCGDDEIIYQIDPKFQEQNGKADLPPNKLTIRFPAKLYAASQPILSDEEQEQQKMLEALQLTSGVGSFRNFSRTVRPGGPIYIRVIDYDMSKNPNKPDSVFVDIKCSSGDELIHYELKETGDCTGVFEAKIKTDIPFPNTIVSDVIEGIDVNAVINSGKTGSWKSQPDGKRPKWLEIDTMTSSNFAQASLTMPRPTQIKNMSVIASIDKTSETLATFPAIDASKIRGGLRVVTRQNVRASELRGLESLFQRSSEQGLFVAKPSFNRDLDQKLRGRDMHVSGMMTGAFFVPNNQPVEFKFNQPANDTQNAYLLIDGKLIISGRMNVAGVAMTRSLMLTRGVHTMTVYFHDSSKNSAVDVAILKQDGSYETIPAEWFSTDKNPELAEYLRPKGKITQTATGFELKMEKPLRYRKLRWVFEDYSGSQIEVTKAGISDDKGKVIVPCAQDLTSGKNNDILEIAAADTITVTYEDKNRIDDNKAQLSETLSSSFCDAQISFNYEEVTMDEEGKTRTNLAKALRVSKGDDIIITVIDPDEDRSEERETVKVQLVTSNNEKIEIELLEGKERGHFSETFRIGDKTDASKRMIKMLPGDKITARYLDKENNHPGIPFYREASIVNEEGTKPVIVVYDTQVEMIEDRSPAALAKIKMMKDKGGKRVGDIKLYKEHYVANAYPQPPRPKKGEAPAEEKPLIVNSKAPLMLEVICPALAKHANSKTSLEVLTQTEIEAANAERREQNPLRLEMGLATVGTVAGAKGYPTTVKNGTEVNGKEGPLGVGLFAGVVRLQLGSANDEINDLVTSNNTFNLLSDNNVDLSSSTFKVPTVIVSGSDQIFISFKDSEGRELAKKTVQLRSDGEMQLLDKNYLSPNTSVHLGQHFYVQVHDPDRDKTPERDTVEVEAVSEKTGDKITLKLSETLVHSGIFTGSMKVELKGKPLQGETEVKKLEPNTLWSNFGDKVTFTYTDEVPLHGDQPRKVVKVGEVVIGSDGELAAFTKRFKDPDMAVKTNFLMAEALFEMAKSHKALKGADGKPDQAKKEQAKKEIAKAKRVLEEALRDYPNSSLKAQGEYLLANLSQQLEEYKTAISQFSTVISRYPDSEYAPKSYFAKAVCYEKLSALEKDPVRKQQVGDMACEEFVRLTYLYPSSSLATDAKLRLGNYYYRTKRYRLACSVLEKFGLAHPEHPMAAKGLLLAGYACRRNEQAKEAQARAIKREYKPDYTDAIRIFTVIDEKYKDRKSERAEAMYFAGDSCFLQGAARRNQSMQVKAYQFFQRLVWDYPETKWAKVARGRMAANPIKNTR